jgi:hypothetical protein
VGEVQPEGVGEVSRWDVWGHWDLGLDGLYQFFDVVGRFRIIVLEEGFYIMVAFVPYCCYCRAGENTMYCGGGCAEAAVGAFLDGGVIGRPGIRLVKNVKEEADCSGGGVVAKFPCVLNNLEGVFWEVMGNLPSGWSEGGVSPCADLLAQEVGAEAVADVAMEGAGVGCIRIGFINCNYIVELVLEYVEWVVGDWGCVGVGGRVAGREGVFGRTVSSCVADGWDVALSCVGVDVFERGGGSVVLANVDGFNGGHEVWPVGEGEGRLSVCVMEAGFDGLDAAEAVCVNDNRDGDRN